MTVQDQVLRNHPVAAPAIDSQSLDGLRETIEHLAHLLPAQGPITAFVHHNTLHAFEDRPFDQAVKKGESVFGCRPYLSETEYRRLLRAGRIQEKDLRAVLLDDLDDHADGLIGRLGTRYHLRLAMLRSSLETAPVHELHWLLAESDALRRFRPGTPASLRKRTIDETRHWVMRDLRNGPASASPKAVGTRNAVAELIDRFGKSSIETWSDAKWEAFCLELLWQTCRQGVRQRAEPDDLPKPPVRHRDVLLNATGEDTDELVHGLLIRLCAAYLDQGVANWPLPRRDEGLYRAFLQLYQQPAGPPERWLRGLRAELQRLADSETGPVESIAESLEILGVEPHQREPFLSESLLALRGWAGMIWQTETRGDRVAHAAPEGSLIDFVAVRLILERQALAYAARTAAGFRKSLSALRWEFDGQSPARQADRSEHRAFQVFQLAQNLGWSPQDLDGLTDAEWSLLIREIDEFSGVERRRVFQEAYERRYRIQTLDAVAAHPEQGLSCPDTPHYQVICCIDEREESFRRHLEEIAPDCETLGAAGFFGVAMYYRGASDAHFKPLCPPIVRPQHYVQEDVVYTFEETHRRRAKTRQVLGTASYRWHIGSRTFFGGIFTTMLGALASFPLVARILFPRLTAQIRRLCGRFVQPPPVTKLQLERGESQPGPADGCLGYSLNEMADIVERLLRDMGLAPRCSPLVIVMGHGSSSLNNPHEAAHDCGACGGARGGPNARAFAQMANDLRVRELVAGKGVEIPAGTVFQGAYHNTCDDSVVYFDLDRLPSTHKDLFRQARAEIDLARERSAHERSRRFESAPLNLTTEAALRHVEGRAEDLAQTRPEYGHATNSLCFVGRRSKNLGLFLDRRAFLTSYDPNQDDGDQTVLTRILQAVIPVCAGISLEYYFSFVDSTGYGCGTKLPHNVASLLGVMDGAASDLRPGLPWQMVEIHEPMRLLFIIETAPDAMLRIMDRNEAIGKLCRNRWVQIATQHPATGEIHVLQNGEFKPYHPESDQLPSVGASIDWYRGWRDHLGFATVNPAMAASGQSTEREAKR